MRKEVELSKGSPVLFTRRLTFLLRNTITKPDMLARDAP